MSILTDEQALDLAAKHGMKVAGLPAAERRMADFVKAIYKEGHDAHVMRVDAGSKCKPSKAGD